MKTVDLFSDFRYRVLQVNCWWKLTCPVGFKLFPGLVLSSNWVPRDTKACVHEHIIMYLNITAGAHHLSRRHNKTKTVYRWPIQHSQNHLSFQLYGFLWAGLHQFILSFVVQVLWAIEQCMTNIEFSNEFKYIQDVN